jgi:hypothetical protein
VRLVFMSCFVVVLQGCIALPIPHNRPYSPRVVGTVVDSETQQPISDALVRLEGRNANPPLIEEVRSAADGTFSVQASKRALWMALWFGPAEGFCAATVVIAAPGYIAETKEFRRFGAASGKGVCAAYKETWKVLLRKEAPNISLQRDRDR